MITILHVLLIVLLDAPKTDGGVDYIAVVKRMNGSDWRNANARDISALVGHALSQQWQSDDRCPSVIYELAGSNVVVFRFDGSLEADRCVQRLTSMTYRETFKNIGDAEGMRLRFIEALRPGGVPSISDDTFTFLWRSIDSETRLSVSLGIRHEGTGEELKVILSHEAVAPASVDYLPFERGYMGCQRP